MKTVFITGCSSGIGKATALYFAQQGWNVVATMRDPKKAIDLKDRDNILCLACDVTQTHTIKRSIDTAIKQFGAIDVLVNNAGFGMEGTFEGASAQEVEDIFGTNVFGLMNVTRTLLPHFRKQHHGVIVNISSMGGRTTFPFYSLYHATKWAVEGFTESLSYELSSLGISVKLIEPGVIQTNFYEKMEAFPVSKTPLEYRKYLQKTLGQKQKLRTMGAAPRKVAETIFRAATDESRQLRYTVGMDAFILTLMRKIFPDRLYQFLVRLSMR